MLEFAFAQRALAAVVIVGLLCGLLGFFVVLRRLAFIGVGISHSAVGGVAVGLLLGIDPRLSAALFAVAVALGMFWIGRSRRVSEDAIIGVFLSASMALGLVLLSLRHGFQQDLFGYLFGSVLAISPGELAGIAVLAGVVALIVFAAFRELLFIAFDEEVARVYGRPVDLLDALLLVVLAVTIVAGVRVVGVLLIEALLVVPAATAALWTLDFRRQIAMSMALGALSGIAGLVLSYQLDVAAGGAIVLVAVSCFFLSLFVRRAA
ncbi:MAG TPA: metal ABC transporter permease [Candidatus Limnocylindrales bacterium]|nr:metal ABC transporter permease [Candidatus Limnocylindrales bacterium]